MENLHQNLQQKEEQKYHFAISDLEKNPDFFYEKGITQISLDDGDVLNNKVKLLSLINLIQEKFSSIYFTFYLKPSVIDKETVEAFSMMPCTLQFDFLPEYLDKSRKFFNKKINLLNDYGLVFGFDLNAWDFPTMKGFRNSIDEALNFYPNHIYIHCDELKPTDKLSTQDIKNIKKISFALEVFYSFGRAVPWFLAAIQPLKIRSSQFFSDFAEWQTCNNCSLETGFDPETATHLEIEKMQLIFLKLKYEEKNLNPVFLPLKDLVKLHGAFSRASFEGEESTLETSYNPEDILSPYAMNLVDFTEEVCLENYSLRVFCTDEGPDFQII